MSGQRNETQGYSLALSCLNQRDYSKGIQHALQYVNARPGDVRVHELLGQLYEGKKDWKKAVESYKLAMQLDPQKTKLGLKVVALYCKLPDEIERLRYWTNQASKKYSNDPIIHEAWECIFKGTKQLDKYADYLRKQLQTDPLNSLFNVKLLDCLTAQRRLAEASEQLDAMLDTLHNDEIALQQIASTSEKLLSEGAPSSPVNLLTSLCYMTQTCLANSNKTSSQCLELLMRLGQKCTELEPKLNKVDGVFRYPCQGLYMSEFRGQFYYLVGTYLLQLGLAGTLAANDFLSMTTALYSLSLREDAIRRNNLINMGWKPLHARIISRLSCNRFGQIGHFLRNVSENHGEEYMDDCQRKWCNVEGRREVLSQVFGAGGNTQFVRSSSFLFSREHEIVSQSDLDGLLNGLFEVNQESVAADPENFQLLVWTCLQWDTRPDGIPSDFGYFVEETFSKLAFSTNKLKIMTIDNLKILDIEAFVYAVVLVVRAMFASQEMRLIGSLKIPQKNLPLLALKQKLKLKEQEEWFSAIYSLCHSKGSTRGYGKLRVIAQRGLEVLRCGSNHNNETQVLIQLGRIMNERRLELIRADGEGDRSRAYHAMSVMYWTEAIGHLKKLQNNGTLLRPQKAFFPHVYNDIKKEEIKEYIDEGSVVLADFFSQNGDLERGLSYLQEVKSSEGLFVKASMYKQLADKESVSNLEYQLSPTKLTDRGELLDKAKHSLYETMDSISGRANHPLHEQVKNLLADIEQEQDDVAGKIAEMDGSPSSPPAIGNESSIYHSLATPGASMLALGTNDPSPQRLASEIRSLNLSQLQMERDRDETRRMIELQNKTLDQNQSIIEQQNKLVEHILNMTPVVHGESHPNPRRLTEGSGDSSVLKKISEQNEKLFEVMNTMKTQFADLKKDVVDLKEKMSKLELEQQKNKERELHKPSVKPPSQTPPSVASPAPIQMGMPAATMMPSHKHLYQQPLYHHSGITYVPHPQYPGYVVPIDSGFHPGMMTSTPAMRRSGTPQTALPVYTGLYDHGGSPTEEDEELKQQFGKADLGLGEQRMYQDTPGQSLLTSSSQYPKMPSSGTPMRSMLGSWQSPSGVGGSILSGAVPTHSPKTLGMQGQKMDAASTVAAFAAAAGQRQQLPTMGAQPMAGSMTAHKPIATSVPNMGGQPSVSTHNAPKPIVTSMSTAKPSSQDLLIKSPTPASQLSTVQPTKSEGVSQSPFAGFSFSKSTSSSSGFMSNPAFQSPKPAIGQPAATTSNTASPFAGLSFKPSSTKADNFAQPAASGSSAAQQYPQLTALLAHGGTTANQEESDPDSPRPGFFAPSQPSESATRKPGQSPMNLKTQTSSQPKETEKSPAQIQDEDEDVVFVAEKKATPEQISKAEGLMLPRHFYLYEEKPPCPGCRGCDEEDLKAKKGVVDSGPQPPKESTLFVEKPKVSAAPATGLFSNSTFSGLTFASLSADGDAGFRKSDSSKTFTFANAGAQVFGSKQDNDNASEDPEYDPHYEPIISLPEKVDLTTGDEGEEVVFRERSRLYRFDRASNVWKERGVGEMKILKNPDTGRTRILMRREQVLKVCANHWLTPNMKLERMSTSDRAWVWFALDFAEGEECHEQFAIKFKTPSLAEEFKETFDRMKQVGSFPTLTPSEAEEQDQLVPEEQQEEKTQTKEEEEETDAKEEEEEEEEEDMSHRFQVADPVVTHPQEDEEDQGEYEGEYDDDDGDEDYDEDDYDDEDDDDGDYDDEDEYEEDDDEYDAKYDAKPSLADQFKPPAGSWECDTCMIQNKPGTTSCAACQSLKPGTTAAPGPSTGSNFSFGGSKPAGGPFTLAPGAFNLQPPSSFSFSSNPSAFSAGTSSTAFKMPPSTFSFAPQAAIPSAASSSSGSAGFTLPSTFSFTKPESSDSSAGTSAVKSTTAAPFSFSSMSGVSTLAGSESVKSGADSTARDAQPGKPSDQTSIQSSSAVTNAPSSTFTFKPEMTQFSFGSPGQSKPSSGFSFGGSPKGVSSTVSSSDTSQAPAAANQSPMAFGGGNQATPVFGGASSSSTTSAFQGFSFNPKPSSSSSDPPGDKKEAMSFSELVKSQGQFNFRLDVNNVASSPPKSTAKSPSKSPGLNKSGEYYQDEERDDIYFEPVVTLPENVKLETGEEGEEIKFSHRAKLYRFDQEGSQWKERGIGDIKVLYNPETKKHRIVMRREQVLKVCANHYITEHVDLQPNKGSDRSWVWHAMDISDGEVQNEQLAVRFKTEEAAKGFKDAVTKAKQEL